MPWQGQGEVGMLVVVLKEMDRQFFLLCTLMLSPLFLSSHISRM